MGKSHRDTIKKIHCSKGSGGQNICRHPDERSRGHPRRTMEFRQNYCVPSRHPSEKQRHEEILAHPPRLDSWSNKKYDNLIETTIKYSDGFRSNLKDHFNKEHTTKVFQRLILQGRTRAAVRWATERENNAILDPWSSTDKQTGELVMDVLKIKHPAGIIPPKYLLKFNNIPNINKLDVYQDTIDEVAHKMGGSGDPGGSDGESLQKWLLHFGAVSKGLQKEVSLLIEHIANKKVKWESIRGFMAGRLIALNKPPGVRPIGIGESWRRLFAKVIMKITVNEATEGCGV